MTEAQQRNRENLIAYFEAGCKTRSTLGFELEHILLHRENDAPVSYTEPGGIRDVLGVYDRPLTNCMIKPCISWTPDEGAELFYEAAVGGIDIVIKLLKKRYSYINFGTLMLMMDAVIITAYALIFNRHESAMYSVVAMFVVSKVVDLALYGLDNSSMCFIISEKSEELTRTIISGTMHRGVTILEGQGAYSHQEKHVIMCVIKRTQFGELRRVVRSVDENAFFVVTDAKNVFGKGFDNISEIR